MWGELHESKKLTLVLPGKIQAGKANRMFNELGATLYYDVYSFEAEHSESWQSKTLLSIALKLNGNEVDAQDDFNQIDVTYLLAYRPSSDQSTALALIEKLIKKFNCQM